MSGWSIFVRKYWGVTMVDKVAVYGTLRKGFRNHHHLKEATYNGTYRIPDHRLFVAFGMVPGVSSGGDGVVVESYSNFNLESLDQLEGEGHLYHRAVVSVGGDDHYMYYYPDEHHQHKLIRDGDYSNLFKGDLLCVDL